MMRRRRFIACASGAICAIGLAVPVIASDSPAVIGYLTGGDVRARADLLQAFRDEMRDLGYREGEHYRLEARGAAGKFDILPQLSRELLELRPRVLLASTSPGALEAKRATSTVPIVMVSVGDPVGLGIVTNLARPTGNVTGLTNSTVELPGKRLELLRELLPDARRVAVLVNPEDDNAPLQIARTQEAAAVLGLELDPIARIAGHSDVEPAFAAAVQAGATAAIRLVDPLTSVLRKEIVGAAIKYRLPTVFAFREDAEAGGIAAFGARQSDSYRRAAYFVHRLLSGASPSDLPVERPIRFELVINLATARTLGVRVPDAVVARADEVIE